MADQVLTSQVVWPLASIWSVAYFTVVSWNHSASRGGTTTTPPATYHAGFDQSISGRFTIGQIPASVIRSGGAASTRAKNSRTIRSVIGALR